jgi:tRNA-Thr(GGU) m(6)t(6)A37 methyltransferase TsaA
MTRTQARVKPIGVIHSRLKRRASAPKQGSEGAPDAWLEIHASFVDGLDGIAVGDEILVITWLHRARRDVLKVHPRSDRRRPLAGVFATRSPDRPNPIGIHRVTVRKIAGNRLRIGAIEAIDGTPVVDIKPVLDLWER